MLITENGFTPEQERQMIKETKAALKRGKKYNTVEEMVLDVVLDQGNLFAKRGGDPAEGVDRNAVLATLQSGDNRLRH
jgi:hypothetical protein